MQAQNYPYREFLEGIISPVAISVLDRMSPTIEDLYNLDHILDTPLPLVDREYHETIFVRRLKRIVRTLPPHISPMPNEVFTACEFLTHEVHGEPVQLGTAIIRLEALGEEIKADPLLHSLITGSAN